MQSTSSEAYDHHVNVLCLDCKSITLATRSGRCPECRAARQRAVENHPTRRQVKALRYDQAHRKLRVAYTRSMEWGTTYPCARCGEPIDPSSPWDLDHVDGGQYPSHAHCNRAARRIA